MGVRGQVRGICFHEGSVEFTRATCHGCAGPLHSACTAAANHRPGRELLPCPLTGTPLSRPCPESFAKAFNLNPQSPPTHHAPTHPNATAVEPRPNTCASKHPHHPTPKVHTHIKPPPQCTTHNHPTHITPPPKCTPPSTHLPSAHPQSPHPHHPTSPVHTHTTHPQPPLACLCASRCWRGESAPPAARRA